MLVIAENVVSFDQWTYFKDSSKEIHIYKLMHPIDFVSVIRRNRLRFDTLSTKMESTHHKVPRCCGKIRLTLHVWK